MKSEALAVSVQGLVESSPSGFKSPLRHHNKNRGLASSSVNSLLLFRALGQRLGQHLSKSLPFD